MSTYTQRRRVEVARDLRVLEQKREDENPHIQAARDRKCAKLVFQIDLEASRAGLNPHSPEVLRGGNGLVVQLQLADPETWWKGLAARAGVNAPSRRSIEQTIKVFGDRLDALKKAGQL